MTASAGRCPAENQSASTEGRRVAAGRCLPVANPHTKGTLAATERLVPATVPREAARIRGWSLWTTAGALGLVAVAGLIGAVPGLQ